MKKLLSIIVILYTVTAFSQDPYLQKSNADAEKEAVEITEKYNLELVLSGQQKLLFQQKVEEFLIRRYKIEAEMKGVEKLDRLYLLQQEETGEMNDILTRPQLAIYKRVKPRIQPLEIAKSED